MTEQSNMPPDDRELEEFLARRGELSRRYREALPPEPAPLRLDGPVLTQARRELRRAGRAPRRWWQQRFATAAAVLLVAGLAWMVRQQLPPMPPVAAVAPETTPGNAPEVRPMGVPAPAPAVVAPLAQTQLTARTPEAKSQHPWPQPPERKADAVKPAVPAVPPSVAAAGAAPVMKEAPSMQAQAEQPAAAARSAPQGASASVRERSGMSEDLATTTAPAQRAYAPSPEPMSPAPSRPAYIASAPVPAPATPAPTAPVPAEAKKVEPAAACSAAQRAPAQLQARPESGLDSPAWLEQIRRQRPLDVAAARAELACFVAARPREAVPPDLLPLLPAP